MNIGINAKTLLLSGLFLFLLAGSASAVTPPTQGSNAGTWGTDLNNFLAAALNLSDGLLNTNTVRTSDILNGNITATKIAPGNVNGTHIAIGVINATHIALGAINASHIPPATINATHIAWNATNGTHLESNLNITKNVTIGPATGTKLMTILAGNETCGRTVSAYGNTWFNFTQDGTSGFATMPEVLTCSVNALPGGTQVANNGTICQIVAINTSYGNVTCRENGGNVINSSATFSWFGIDIR